jgi:hypothetical protein
MKKSNKPDVKGWSLGRKLPIVLPHTPQVEKWIRRLAILRALSIQTYNTKIRAKKFNQNSQIIQDLEIYHRDHINKVAIEYRWYLEDGCCSQSGIDWCHVDRLRTSQIKMKSTKQIWTNWRNEKGEKTLN